MSKRNEAVKVKDATDAIAIGRQTALAAGGIFAIVSGAKKEGENWIVEVATPAGLYQAIIVATSGEVSEWKLVRAPSTK